MGGVAIHCREERFLPAREALVVLARHDRFDADIIDHVGKIDLRIFGLDGERQPRHVRPLHEAIVGDGAPELRSDLFDADAVRCLDIGH